MCTANAVHMAANFAEVRSGNIGLQLALAPTGLNRFCGTSPCKCPAGLQVGDSISPPTGYQSDALMRATGDQIDPSGNIWMTDNRKINANPLINPGGNAIVIAVGAATPLKTPLIGPPMPFE